MSLAAPFDEFTARIKLNDAELQAGLELNFSEVAKKNPMQLELIVHGQRFNLATVLFPVVEDTEDLFTLNRGCCFANETTAGKIIDRGEYQYEKMSVQLDSTVIEAITIKPKTRARYANRIIASTPNDDPSLVGWLAVEDLMSFDNNHLKVARPLEPTFRERYGTLLWDNLYIQDYIKTL